MMPDYYPEPFQSDDDGGYPWDCDYGDDDLGNYDEDDEED